MECGIDENHFGYKECLRCEYREDVDHLQYVCNGDRCIADAIALLKAQEPVKSEFGGLPSGTIGCTRWYICGQCKYEIDPGDKFCRHCGRAVKWDD